MAGKWAHLRGKYPTLPHDASYEQTLHAAQDTYTNYTVAALTSAINAAEDELAEREKVTKDVKLDLEALYTVFDRKLEGLELDSVVQNGYRWTRSVEPHPNVKDRGALRAWADVHAPDTLQIPWPTLKALTKASLETGEAFPEGIDMYLKQTVSRRKVD